MIVLRLLFSIFKVFNDKKISSTNAGIGFSLGIFWGLSSLLSLHNLLILLIIILFKFSLRAALVSVIVWTPLSYLLSPYINELGYYFLSIPSLQEVLTNLYNSFFILTRFNNTYQMGAVVWGVILFIPSFFFHKYFLITYRETLRRKIIQSRIWKYFSKTKLFTFVSRFYE